MFSKKTNIDKISLLAGAITALALPPIYLFPGLFVGLTILLLQIARKKTPAQAAWSGWWFGVGFWVIAIYWITFSILTEAQTFWWLVPFAVIGLSAILGLYTAAYAYIIHRLKLSPLRQVLALAILWTAGEMFRAYSINALTLYGFPWNLLAISWNFSDSIPQITAWIGVFGLSLITVIVAASPRLAFAVDSKSGTITYQPQALKYVIVITLILPLLSMIGTYRLNNAVLETVPDTTLRLVQANIKEHHRWNTVLRLQQVKKHIELSKSPGYEEITHLVWSESSTPFMIEESPHLLETIAKITPPGGAVLTGAMRREVAPNQPEAYFSTLHVIDDNGKIASVYDKFRLVAFGEYIPHRAWIPLPTLVGGGDFQAGPGPETISVPGAPDVSPLICYDATFPQSVVNTNKRPSWMLNITNDAWFQGQVAGVEISSGPYQHLSLVRLRAIEQGLHLIRVANTGISASINPLGIVEASLPLGTEGVLDVKIKKLTKKETIYSRYGDIVMLLIIGMLGGMIILSKKIF